MDKKRNYKIVSDSLSRFFLNHFSDTDFRDFALELYRLKNYLLPNLNCEEFRSLLHKQQKIYELYNSEIKKIYECLTEEKVLILKGIVLAEELFYPYYIRRSMDLDIYVSYFELKSVENILINNGYKPLNNSYTNNISYIEDNISIRNEITHLVPYKKTIGDFELLIEIHINFCHYLNSFAFNDPRNPIQQARTVYINSMNSYVLTLSTLDTYIHLCAHLFRHFYWEFFRFLRGKNHFEFRHDLLFEIALFFKMHEFELNNNKLIERSLEINQLEPVYYVSKVLNYVYDVIDIDELLICFKDIYDKSHFNNDLSTLFTNSILKTDLIRICTLNGHELANDIMLSIRKYYKINILKYKYKNILELKKHFYNVNLTEIFDNKITSKPPTINGDCTIEYNSDNIIISFKIEKTAVCLAPNTICISFAKDEDCSFFNDALITNPQDKRFSKNMRVFYIYLNDKRIICTLNNSVCNFINVEALNFTIYQKYSITIPWSLIEISPIEGRIINILGYIEFNIHCDEARYYRLQFKKSADDYYSLYHPWPSDCLRFRLL